ncbi:hypothetical protein N9156_03910, partial [Akkermansiaceae bacterium]|nr:hypothetical protein [Akkermansiaceae bacterium]
TDGAGKSTQIKLLEDRLQFEGAKTIQFWARGGYTPLFSLLKGLIRKLCPGSVPQAGPSAERSQQFESSRVRKVWLLLSILDLVLCYAVWLRFKRLQGYTVICDRYIEDSLLDFTRNFPSENVANWYSWKLLRRLTPEPSHHFLLYVTPEESARRSKLKNEPFPDTPDTLEWRYARYQELIKSGKWCAINCEISIEVVHENIVGELS